MDDEDEASSIAGSDVNRLSQNPLTYARGPNNYWRLLTVDDKHLIESKTLKDVLVAEGYSFPKRTSYGELVPFVQRSQIGLMSYDGCSNEELESFLHSRRSDARRRCDRFLELSAEVRDLVFEHYIKSFPSSITTPAAPPLALTSKQMMREVMPRFYNLANIRLVVKHVLRYDFLAPESERFVTSMAPQMLAKIRSLELGNRAYPLGSRRGRAIRNTPHDVKITIHPASKHFHVEFQDLDRHRSVSSEAIRAHNDYQDKINDVMTEIVYREDTFQGFTVADIILLKNAVSISLRS